MNHWLNTCHLWSQMLTINQLMARRQTWPYFHGFVPINESAVKCTCWVPKSQRPHGKLQCVTETSQLLQQHLMMIATYCDHYYYYHHSYLISLGIHKLLLISVQLEGYLSVTYVLHSVTMCYRHFSQEVLHGLSKHHPTCTSTLIKT